MAEIFYQLSQHQSGKVFKVKDTYAGNNVSVDMNDFVTGGYITQEELNNLTLDNFIYDIVGLSATMSLGTGSYLITTNSVSRGNGLILAYNPTYKTLAISFSQVMFDRMSQTQKSITPTVNVYCVIKP